MNTSSNRCYFFRWWNWVTQYLAQIDQGPQKYWCFPIWIEMVYLFHRESQSQNDQTYFNSDYKRNWFRMCRISTAGPTSTEKTYFCFSVFIWVFQFLSSQHLKRTYHFPNQTLHVYVFRYYSIYLYIFVYLYTCNMYIFIFLRAKSICLLFHFKIPGCLCCLTDENLSRWPISTRLGITWMFRSQKRWIHQRIHRESKKHLSIRVTRCRKFAKRWWFWCVFFFKDVCWTTFSDGCPTRESTVKVKYSAWGCWLVLVY